MMGKVYVGGGRLAAPSSSSSSHLSASAPPFTVDRSNSSKPLSNQPSQFSDFPYGSSFAHTWNFANPVPALQSDEYHASELDADSCWSGVNPSAKSSTHPFLYERMPYVSPAVDNVTPLVSVSESNYDLLPSTELGLASDGFSSQVDYTQSLSGLDYPSHWYGLVDAKRGKRAENDGTFHFQKTTTHDSLQYLKQGCDYCKCGNIFGSDYRVCVSCGQFSDSIGRENCNGLVHMEHSDNGSLLSKDGFFPFDSAKRTSLRSEFTNSIPLPLGPSMQSTVESVTYRNPSDPYEKRIQLSDCCVSGSVSVTKSSPSSLIRTSNAGPGIGMLKSAGKSNVTNDVTYVPHHEVISDHNISKEKEPCVMLDPGDQGCSFLVSQAKSNKVDQEFSVFSSIMQEPSSAPRAKDTPNSLVRVSFSSQVPTDDLSIGCSLPSDNAQAIRSQEKFSDGLEHHIDSPCWKGAPALHLSPFDVVETEATPHTMQRSEHCHLNHEDDQMLPLLDPVKSLFGSTGDDQVVYGLGFAAAEQRLMDSAKTKMKSPVLQASKGVQCCEYPSKPGEEHYLPSFFGTQKLGVQKDNFISTEPNIDVEVMDSMVNHDNIKEGGAVAVRAAEDVLSSLSSEESAVVQPKQKSTPRLDVQMLTNSMKNISELLLSYCCSDPCALKEQNLEAIEDVISNLHALLPKKKVHLTRPPAPILLQPETCDKTGDYFDPHVNTDAGRSQVAYGASINAQGQHDYQPIYEDMKNCNGCGENTQIWQHISKIRDDADIIGHASMTQNIGPDVSQVVQNAAVREQGRVNYQATYEKMEYDDRDDLDMFGDDGMTKSIRKVLDENFNCGEELQPLALLFKNLWLEAEAKLCRVSYKTRFDRVKVEMESFRANQMKENSASSEKDSSVKDPQDSITSDVLTTNAKNGPLQETIIQSSANNANNDAAVMARLQILKGRFDQSVGQRSDPPLSFSANNANDVDASVMARLQILKGRSFSEFDQSVGQRSDPPPGLGTDDLANPGSANGRRKCEFSPGSGSGSGSGSNDKNSSEWEHVVKDDAW